MTRTFRFDTETYPIRSGLAAPKLVCLQYAFDGQAPQIVLAKDALPVLREALADEECLIEAHNGAYDQVVTSRAFPELLPMWFRALGQGRGRDTMLREQLLEIAAGTLQEKRPRGWFSLAGIAERRLGAVLDKGEESWRLRYALLDGVPVSEWPAPAVQYALDDVTYLRGVSYSQQAEPYTPPDEWFQVAAAFALALTSAWGLRVDPVSVEWVETALLTEKEAAEKLLRDAGFFSESGSVSKEKLQHAVTTAFRAVGKSPPRTNPSKTFPDGQTKTDADAVEEAATFVGGDEAEGLRALVTHNHAGKMLSTYIQPLRVGAKHHMTCRYNTVAATGRTTSSGSKLERVNPWWPPGNYVKQVDVCGTNAQNWPQEAGIRDCVVPRPGFYFASVDYNSLELRTLGQVCLWLLGESTFAKGYQANPAWDPHTYMGAVLANTTEAEAITKGKADPAWKAAFKKGPRALGKALNFSLAGGVGARRFSEMAMAQYEAGHLKDPVTVEDAMRYKEAYLKAYPEMARYFEVAAWHADTNTPIEHFVSGRVRAGCSFTAAANTRFQGLAADLAKRALIKVQIACYVDKHSPLFGSRTVAFVHDELIVEVPIGQHHEAAKEVERLMCEAFSEVAPDVPPAAEAALMTRWIKAAEPRFDSAGKLIPYDL
jgi:DNA polymerase-1